MLIVSIGGSPSIRSRSGVLLNQARQWLNLRGVEVVSVQVRDFEPHALLHADFAHPQVKAFVEQVAKADALLVATPVYKASFSGALKTLLDLLPERALEHKVVLPIASGGSSAHLLAVDYALKPVLSALKAQEMLHGVFAVDAQIQYAEHGRAEALEAPLKARLEESLELLLAALARRPKPLDPNALSERLLSSRWSM